MSRKRLYYLGKPADGFGWGVANTNLVKALGEFCEVVVDETSKRVDGPAFIPIADSHLSPLRHVEAPRKLGYCFTEWPISDKARRNARQYDVVFAGSEWNAQRLRAAGIKRVAVLQQGVDFERFKPLPPSDRKGFVVFSGGKFEYRKGQDYVIAAMKVFMKYHADAVLITAWHNPWEASKLSMLKSWLINHNEPLKDMPDPSRVIQLPPMPNEKTPGVYSAAHVGLFPNRCEAGTNLVMSEFMACARPVIATYAHGHKDVLSGPGPMLLKTGSADPAGWFNCNVSDILWHLEWAYEHRAELAERGQQCRKLIEPFTWRACAEKIFRAAFV